MTVSEATLDPAGSKAVLGSRTAKGMLYFQQTQSRSVQSPSACAPKEGKKAATRSHRIH